jgi:DNA-binding transcriptional LysR family regulator
MRHRPELDHGEGLAAIAGPHLLEEDWSAGIEVSSIDLVETYAAGGFGIGLSVLVPKAELKSNLRAIPLPKSDFPPVIIGALWRGKPSVLLQAFLDELRLRAKRLV